METSDSFNEPAKSSFWDNSKLLIKAFAIFLMALVLWVPTRIIMNLVGERQGRQQEAIADITSKWAGSQKINGPMIVVPYAIPVGRAAGDSVERKVRGYAFFLPDQLKIDSKVHPEKRYRGIYEIAVYKADIVINGDFKALPLEKLDVDPADILWPEAKLVIDIQDAFRGVHEDLQVKWDQSTIAFSPQFTDISKLNGAIAAPLQLTAESITTPHHFQLAFSLNGSQQLLFTALARNNEFTMRSTWKDPAFNGSILPITREVKDSGFVATWKSVNRSIPEVWKNNVYETNLLVAGTDLLVTVDNYNKTERSVKYALLCIILTFASFFLIETMYKRSLHLIQYGLAGLALVLFYTLLLSISEYLGFNWAYLLATIATVGLVVWYMGSIMRSSKLAFFIAFVLSLVYTYIFSILQLEDSALLLGSVGLFVTLAVIMYFTRRLKQES